MKPSPDGSKFATCSADKSIAVFNTESGDLIKHFKACHKMGAYDLSWANDNEFFTCSADNIVKRWSLDSDAAVKELTQAGSKMEVPRQVLGIKTF